MRREVKEETGIREFQIEQLLIVAEQFFTNAKGQQRHGLNIIYLCNMARPPDRFISSDPRELGPKGIQWLSVRELQQRECSSRCWQALQTMGLVE